MNDRSTTPNPARTFVLAAIMTLICVMLLIVSAHMVGATEQNNVEDRIDELSEKIERLTASADKNGDASADLRKKIDELKRQRVQLEGELASTTTDLETTTKQIAALSKKLDTQRQALGVIIADQTIHGSLSTFEILMSSGSIAEYFDKAAYQASLQRSLDQTVYKIKRLDKELKRKQALVKREQARQRAQIAELGQDIASTGDSLVVIDGQGAHMGKLTASLAAEKQRLQTQQQTQMQSLMGGAEQVTPGTLAIPESSPAPEPKPAKPSAPNLPSKKPDTPAKTIPKPSTPKKPASPKPSTPMPTVAPNGGYPSYLNNCYVDRNALSYGIDPWGYGCRQCVSYTAWKVLQKSGRAAMYWGNAKMWPNSAKSRGYTVSSKPRAKSVGVMMSGPYGHVVWVESVNSNGTINISQYNYWLPNKANGGWGFYSEFRNVRPSTYQSYIYV